MTSYNTNSSSSLQKLTIKKVSKRHLGKIAALDGLMTLKELYYFLSRPNNIGIAAVRNNEILGYMICTFFAEKIYLHTLYMPPQDANVAPRLIGSIKNKLKKEGRTQIEIDVRESDLNLQLFLKAQEFKAVEIIEGWFEDHENSYRFKYFL